MGIAAAAVAVVTAVASASHASKARKERKRANRIAVRRERYQTRITNLRNIEEYRTRVGQLTNVAAQTGNLEGSAFLGTEASLLSQASSNITFNQQLQTFAEAEGRRLEKAAYWDWRSGLASSISNTAGSFAGGG